MIQMVNLRFTLYTLHSLPIDRSEELITKKFIYLEHFTNQNSVKISDSSTNILSLYTPNDPSNGINFFIV